MLGGCGQWNSGKGQWGGKEMSNKKEKRSKSCVLVLWISAGPWLDETSFKKMGSLGFLFR